MFHTNIVQEIKTHILRSVTFFGNHAVCETLWKNVVEQGRSQMTISHIWITCWIPRATNTHTQVV